MTQKSSSIAFRLNQTFDSLAFKKILAGAGYSQTALAQTMSLSPVHDRQDIELMYRRVKADNPYNILVRLFRLGQDISEPTVLKMLPQFDIEALTAIGLLNCKDGTVRANAKLTPYHDLLMASDFGPEIHRTMLPDHVLGVGAASLTLAGLTVRRKNEKVLDLGTGAGIQTFLAARHAGCVIGTDTNLRALNFAAFNAKINEIEAIEWRQGSLYEPAADEKFDLIVSNPPFVISPESKFVFRDTNLPGDTISQQVLQGAGPRLNEGGFACVLFNWYHQDDANWDSRPLSWTSGTDCDCWLLCFKTADPLTYAADWLKTGEGRDSSNYAQYLDKWMAYYEKMGIEQISAGAIFMRKRSAATNWNRSDTIEKGRTVGECGRQVERIFAAEDLLQELNDERELLQHHLLFDKNHCLEHQLIVENGSWVVQVERLHTDKGISFSGNIDMHIARLLAACDGRRSLGQLIRIVADQTKTDPENLTGACLAVVRKLMRAGFLSSVDKPERTA
ncbi:MAG: methyltransferase [Planctomycetota bacterium]|jgi:2-polyprenyl-3-methyl-5-hydroxy-6-metoxy-1,4-benzoquinol methylase